MSSSSIAALAIDPSVLRLGPSARAQDLARAQTVLATPPAGHVVVVSDPSAATVQNPFGDPPQLQGMQAAERLGPFIDQSGLSHTVIVLPITTSHPFAFGNVATPFGAFPIVNAPANATTFTLGAGSVWFETRLLVPTVAAGNLSGFRISGGTLTASGPVALQGSTYVAPAGATLTLTANLAPPATGTGSPGADLTGATIALPATVTITFSQTAATIQALANSSVTVYGSTVGLTWNHGAPQALTGFPAILIPCTASVTGFDFKTVASKIFQPAGHAALNAAGWSLPIATTNIGAVGEASGAGSLVLELGAGASLVSATRNGKGAIGGWLVGIDPTQLVVIAGGTGPANLTGYTLWPATPPATVRSVVGWFNPAGFIASLRATPGQEVVGLSGFANGFLDRPLAVDGGALPMAGNGSLFLTLNATTTTLAIIAAPATPPTQVFSLALENALVSVRAPRFFVVTGPLANPSATQLTSATATILLDARWLVPTLPDPYAANFDVGPLIDRLAIGLLGATLTWAGGTATDVGFMVGITPAPATPVAGSSNQTILPARVLTLLDLSTNADLFGVQIEGAQPVGIAVLPPPVVGFQGLNLAISDAAVATFALPAVSWEPMVDATTSPPGAILPVPATDGPPTLVQAAGVGNSQTLVPVAPEPVLLRKVGNVAAGAPFAAQFSLPFGMIANISQPNEPPVGRGLSLFAKQGGQFSLVQPNFAAGSGALQLTLKPPNPSVSTAKFGGSTTLSTIGAAPGYGTAVLGSDVATIFTNEFSNNGGVPVRRADLAGYGASIWSEWADPSVKGTAIIKVQFETVVGRTAYEVVKAQTTLYPHGVRLVRTVTIARQNAGWVQRTDSGWIAATPGLYNFPNAAFPQTLVNRGAVAGVFNVRNVREFETVVAGGFTYRRALFDADVGLDHRVKVTAGGHASTFTDVDGNPVTLVPARNLTGYVQIAPDESGSPPPPNPDPGPADLALLFGKVGPITDSFACTAEIGGTATAAGTVLRCTGVSFAMTPGGAPALGAALLSSPALPRDGHWGFGKRASAATAPVPLPQGVPVPLVQARSDPSTWHFADIQDVLQLASPANVYGLLQDTGTQKTLFERPTVKDLSGGAPPGTVPSIQLPAGVAPALADLGSLLGATGLFPDISKTISFLTGAVEQLQTIPQGLHYTKSINFKGDEDPTTLIDLGVLQVALTYADTSKGKAGSKWNSPTQISFNIDPAHTLPDANGRNWWLTIGPISFVVTIPEFGSDPLLTIVGGFAADDRTKPGLTGLTLDYGAALSTLQSIFDKLQSLASFLPGGKGAGLDVSLSAGQLTVRDSFALPTLPLGIGDLSDVSLDLGLTLTLSPLSADFIIGIGSPDNPFNWIVSPLAGNGAIEVGVKNGAPDFLVQAGIGLGLAIDVGIAEGSASITLAFSLEVNGSTITVMIILNGQASVDVLGGLASASLSLTAAIGVSIDPLPVPTPHIAPPGIDFPAETITFLASVAVGIHISICWVVSVDFEGSWQFSQAVHTPQLTVDL